MSAQNWRPEIGAEEFFGHQNKKLQVADRRPVIRNAADLVGPGIGAYARRITDYNAPLATLNGYFSSNRAINGPSPLPSGENAGFDVNHYVGFTVSDSELGGVQVITDLETRREYRRVFRRLATDSQTIAWSPWESPSNPVASAEAGEGPLVTPTLSGIEAVPGALSVSGPDETFSQSPDGTVEVTRPGVYSGVFRLLNGLYNQVPLTAWLEHPSDGGPPSSTGTSTQMLEPPAVTLIPFMFRKTGSGSSPVSVMIQAPETVSNRPKVMGLQIMRVGDA